MENSVIRFVADEDGRHTIIQAIWLGEWPPPERMAMVTGRLSGESIITTAEKIAELSPSSSEFVEVVWFTLRNWSKLSDKAAANPASRVIRGAEYIRETSMIQNQDRA